MPQPTNLEELRTFLGMATYLSKHIPNFSDQTKNLRDLTMSNADFVFHEQPIESFESLKNALAASPVLGYYSNTNPITISCDASKHGLGASLWQSDHPIAHAS